MAREPRFPEIDWYCDHCGALLNNQKHFDDHKYTWKCTECGYKNSISWDNIQGEDPVAVKLLLYLIGFLSYLGLWTGIMLAVAMFVFHADRNQYFMLFLASVGLYVLAFAFGLFVEFAIRHTTLSKKNLIYVIFRNLKEDIIAPFMAIKEMVSTLFSSIRKRLSKKYAWKSNKVLFGSAIVYTAIIIIEFIVLSRIIDFHLSDWSKLVMSMISYVP